MTDFSLAKDSPIPYYYQIEECIRGQITRGELLPGDMLPSEMTLSQQLGVSRIVVRQALKDLTNEGLLVRRRAIGTFIAYPRRVIPFVRDRLRGLTEEMGEAGLKVRSKVLEQVALPATGEVQKELQMSVGEEVLMIRRLRSVNNIPIVIETTYHPYKRFPELLKLDLNDCSTYEILEKRYHSRPVEARDRFIADIATKDIAALLDIDVGAPVMRYKRTAKDASGQRMEFTLSIYRADQYQFVIEYSSQDR